MSNEVKIGILAVVTIALSLWGYKFIVGKNMLVKSNNFKVVYNEVEGLQIGTQVRISGVRVGSVGSVTLQEDQSVLVVLVMDRDVRVPKNTVAAILSTGFMGGKAIELIYKQPCEGDACAKSGDFLEGRTKGLVSSMMGPENLDEYMTVIKKSLQDVIDTLNYKLLNPDSGSPIAQSFQNLSGTLENLNSATGQVDQLMRRSSGSINGAMSNLASITGNIEAKNGQISSIIDQADSLSRQLATADLQRTIQEIGATIENLKKTLSTADQALYGVSATLEKVNQGEGTLGKMLQDDGLYNQLNQMSFQADSLLTDFQERPYRYMPLKSRRKVKKFDRLDAKGN